MLGELDTDLSHDLAGQRMWIRRLDAALRAERLAAGNPSAQAFGHQFEARSAASQEQDECASTGCVQIAQLSSVPVGVNTR